jgi:hypothetical protein
MDFISWLIAGTVVLVCVVLYKFSNRSSDEPTMSSSVAEVNVLPVTADVVVETAPVVSEAVTEVPVKKVRKPRATKTVAKPAVKTAKKKTSKKKTTLKVV